MTDSPSRIAGVDDAGRGAILGPLVIAGICVNHGKLSELSQIGVKDSKLLSPNARSRLYPLITQIAEKVVVVKVTPEEVDRYVLLGRKYRKLNYLEAVTMGKVVDDLECEKVYVDASDVDEARFKEDILQVLQRKVEIISEHHADRTYPVVSAASIVAKVNRDAEVEALRQSGDFGSGYPSDPKTRRFLQDWLSSHGQLPPFSRRSWKTWKKLGTRTLDDL